MILVLLFCFWGEPLQYGAPIKAETPLVSIATLMADPEAYLDRVVRVKGKVAEVCPKAGCWLDLDADGQKLRVKVKDGEIVFEQKLVGKEVFAEGTVYKFDLTREQAVGYYRHLAEEKGEAFDPESVKKGTTIYQIGGLGVATLAQKP